MMLSLRGILAGIPLLWFSLLASATEVPPGFEVQEVLSGIEYPTGVAFLPDGRMLTWLKPGDVLLSDPASPASPATLYLALVDVNDSGERGLIDLTLDPDFEDNGHFYVFYSHASSERQRVSRFTHQGTSADPASELVIWQAAAPWSSCCHVGGGLDFGPDGYLYLTTGDGFSTNQPQDLGRSGGKILRFGRDGSVPPDNPFLTTPGALPEVWALGLRNPFRARFDDATGRLFVAEVGSNDHQTALEDIALGEVAGNYGWPFCEGICGDPQYVDPIHSYPHAGSNACVIGGVVYRGWRFPPAWHGRYFYADFSRGWVRALELDAQGELALDLPFASDLGAIVALEQGPAGELYYVVLDEPGPAAGAVRRIVYTQGGPPGVGAGSGAARSGGLAHGSVHRAGEPPVATIDQPLDGDTFRFGDQVQVSGSAFDPDGQLSSSDFSWHVVALAGSAQFPLLGPLDGAGFDLPIEDPGLGVPLRELVYELRLSVTDSDGFVATDAVRIHPELVALTFDALPSGVPISVAAAGRAGDPRATPFSLELLVAEPLAVSVPRAACLAGRSHRFLAWSSGAPREHVWTVPEAPASLVAELSPPAAGADGCGCNRSLSFDGLDDLVQLPGLDLARDFTLEAWVRPLSTGAFDGIFAERRSALERGLHLRDGLLVFRGPVGSGFELVSASMLVPGQWTHVAVSRTGLSTSLLVNGVSESAGDLGAALRLDVVGVGWSGELDELRVWQRGRGASEIAADMHSTRPADPTGLVAAWNLDDDLDSQVVFDASGNDLSARLGPGLGVTAKDPVRTPSSAPVVDRPACPEPGIRILAPRAGQVLPAGSLEVAWAAQGHASSDLARAQLDSGEVLVRPAVAGQLQIPGVGPGPHRLVLDLADASGQPYPLPSALDQVRFELVGPLDGPLPRPAGRCLDFDGLDDQASIPRVELPGDFTIEAWVQLDSTISNRDGIVHNVDEVGGRRDINFHHGQPRMWVGTNVVVAQSVVTPGRWTHVAVTRAGSELALYVDGLVDATGSWEGTFAFNALGRANAGRTDGRLDEVRVWAIARSAGQILANHRRRVAADAPGLLAAWSFDEAPSDQVVGDRTGSGYDGSLGASTLPASDDPRRVASDVPRLR